MVVAKKRMPMAKPIIKRKIRKDALWKGVVEDFSEDFVRYFFPEYAHLIDFSRGLEPKEQELRKLLPNSSSVRRHADKLFKAYLKGGGELWFLIYFEAQGYPDPNFARRVFQVTYRIYDFCERPPAVLVLYTDKRRHFHFQEFSYSFFGAELKYRFPTFILMDHAAEELDKDGNIFGFILQAAREEMDLHGKGLDMKRMSVKFKLLRRLFDKPIPAKARAVLADFINYYIGFEQEELYHQFDQTYIELSKQERAMGVRETIIQELSKQFAPQIKRNLREEFEPQIKEELKSEFEPQIKEELKSEFEPQIKEELKSEFEPQIKEELKSELEPQIKQEIEAELKAQALQELKAQAEQEMVRMKELVEQEVLQKERAMVSRAWKKGMTAPEIAELTDMPAEKVEIIIQALLQEQSKPE
jgi:hypothetical protein